MAAVGMLATVGITMTVDVMDPLQIMLEVFLKWLDWGQKSEKITDQLDAVGNTTAAVGKGLRSGRQPSQLWHFL